MRKLIPHPCCLLVNVVALLCTISVFGENSACVWLEGESATTEFKVNISGWGRPQFLSNDKWLHVSIDEDKVEKGVPNEGIHLKYSFQVDKAGHFEIWNRVGFEFVRSPFDWQMDDGPWKSIAPDVLTTDLMELATWCEVAWLKMGEADLTAGDHQLRIRLNKAKNDKGKWQRILYASDALCIHEGPFLPNSKFRPDTSGRDDKDIEAEKVVFQLPEAKSSQRSEIKLKGTWEIARDDEQLPGAVAEPIKATPANPVWKAITVPGDKNKLREDLIFAHRLWYRTRVMVPASMSGRAFYIDFPYNNLNTTVFANGIYCGFEKNPFAPFQIDVTPGIKSGQTNEIWVGIRDAWYGRSADPTRPLKLRKTFNYPIELFSRGFQDMDYPVWNCPQSGILATPTFIAAGSSVYVSDVFAKPAISKKSMNAEIAVKNQSATAVSGEVRWEAADDKSGQVENTVNPQPFRVDAGQSCILELSGAWQNPKLWWPDSPNLYRLRTVLLIQGKPVDVKETVFGFREWRIEGAKFTLNGVVWHMWADLVGEKGTLADWLEVYRRTNQRTTRMGTAGQASQDSRWHGLEPQEALEFCDRNGVVVRRNTTLDGETIGYHFSESDPETRKQQGGVEIKLALMKNWRDQCVAQVRGERNHPSIQIWSLENEFAYINLINLLGNSPNMDRYEEEIAKTHDAVMAVDPTRSAMVDGGGALKKNTLSVHGDHYLATLDARYPDLAYEPFVEGGGRGRWKWDMQRPRFVGEDFYATGINPADYACWGGEVAFQGKAATRDSIALIYRMLNEGYRWGGYYGAWHLWVGGDGGSAQWGANNPQAVFARQWNWTFGTSQKVNRTFGIFNDTQYSEPITFIRQLIVDGKEAYVKSTNHKVAPGTAEKFDEEIPMPAVTQRLEGQLILTLQKDGKTIYQDDKPVSVLPPVAFEKPAAGTLALLDPSGVVSTYLKSAGISFAEVQSLDALPVAARVLLIGRNAINSHQNVSPRLAAYASEGRSVVILDQANPLQYQAIPAEMELAPRSKKNDFGTEIPTADGSVAFIEDASHPVLQGLKDKDFFTWGPNQLVYRNAYVKPTRGGKSLVQCGPRLEYSALVEIPVGKGVMYLSQLDTGKLASNPVAQHVLANLLRSAAAYKLEFRDVIVSIQDQTLGERGYRERQFQDEQLLYWDAVCP